MGYGHVLPRVIFNKILKRFKYIRKEANSST